MKKLIFITLIFVACSEDNDPVFKMEDSFFEARFDKFVEIAGYYNKTVPRNNLILRFTEDADVATNNSKSYKEGDQLYIDIDKKFKDFFITNEDHNEMILFQHLANALYNTPFRDCGIMKRVVTSDDLPPSPSWDYGDYPVLFDSAAQCAD